MNKIKERRKSGATCPKCKSPDYEYNGRVYEPDGKHQFKCKSCGASWQYGKTDIVTDLLRDDISKTEAIDKLLVLSNVSARNWAKMREDACRVREQVAIKFILEVYCDVEVTEELQKDAYEDFKKRYVR